jgi:hypothetical protein
MYTRKMVLALVLGLFFFVARPFTIAQDANAEPKPASLNPGPQKPLGAYRLAFSINELEDGKKINTRRYSMNLTDGGGGGRNLKIGTRVPVQAEQGKFEYLDIGTNINAQIRNWETPLGLYVNAEISSFPASNEGRASGIPPLIRQLRIEGTTVIVPDKPMIIGSVDDPDSKREFQLEVLVTKLQ